MSVPTKTVSFPSDFDLMHVTYRDDLGPISSENLEEALVSVVHGDVEIPFDSFLNGYVGRVQTVLDLIRVQKEGPAVAVLRARIEELKQNVARTRESEARYLKQAEDARAARDELESELAELEATVEKLTDRLSAPAKSDFEGSVAAVVSQIRKALDADQGKFEY